MARYGAIDIGSNSIRMMAADVTADSMRVLASDRQVTRLGESVFRGGLISEDAMTLVCDTLARMSEAVRRADPLAARVVATSAVRDASNQEEFLERAQQAAGMPVEIISGQEEARLIHLGVQARWPHPDQRILIVDVGGGSAELITGQRGRLEEGVSKPLGAVRLTTVFLKSDPPKQKELRALEEFIDEKILATVRRIGTAPLDRCIGTSATAAALVSAVHRIPRPKRDEADRTAVSTTQVEKLYKELSGADVGDRRKMPGVGPRRAEIIVAGAAVFLKILQRLNQPGLFYSTAGVRDGILSDLASRGVGWERNTLSTEQQGVVEGTAEHYGVDMRHARRVADFAMQLFIALEPWHQLPPAFNRLLQAAAFLYDTGHYVADVGHHKHSWYLVQNSDLPGFTTRERALVAALCRYHRKTLPSPKHEAWQALAPDDREPLQKLVPLLRLAYSLDHRKEQRIQGFGVQLKSGSAILTASGVEDTGVEMWAFEQAGLLFQQIYDKTIQLVRSSEPAARITPNSVEGTPADKA